MQIIDPKIFKAYDIRGIYPTALDEDLAYRIGRVFAQLIKEENPQKPVKIVLSRDMRLSGESIHKEIISAFADEDIQILDIGLASTPMFYFAVTTLEADGGMQISASHNPKEYNGFKLTRYKAMPINGDNGIYKIRDLVLSLNFTRLNKKIFIEKLNLLPKYLEHAKTYMKSLKKELNLVVDSANAMAGLDLEDFFKTFHQIKVSYLNRELDGSFPAHEANPLKEETLEQLKKEVVRLGADLGIATDGDGDRYMFIDEKGKFVRPDLINALLARKTVKEASGKPILYDLRSSKTVEEKIKECGGQALKCRVGHSFIKEQMRKNDAFFAGELSGHYYLEVLPDAYFEFPLYVVSKLLEIIEEDEKPLSEITKPLLTYFHTNEFNFKVEKKDEIVNSLKEKYQDAHQFELDGLSVEYPTWWFNVRMSNTEPLLRFNLEANTKEEMEQKKKEITEIILSLGGEAD